MVDSTVDSAPRWSPLQVAAMTWAEQLVGPHFGLVEHVQRVAVESDDLPIVVYAGRLANTAAFAPVEVPRACSGAGLSAEHALAACLGEAVERYAAGLSAPGSLTRSPAGKLPGRVLTPDRFALFSSKQFRCWSRRLFPFRPWRPADEIGWVRARSLSSTDQAWVPATFVYQPYQPASSETLFAPSLSTGLACASDPTGAVIAGLCEVIERDAVALAWLGRIQPPRAELGGRQLSEETAGIIEMLNRLGFRWAPFDLTTDAGVPVIAVLLQGESPLGPIVSCGSACHPVFDRALHKALLEAVHCRMFVKSLIRQDPSWKAGRGFRSITSFADHARFYSVHREHQRQLERWWSSTPSGDRDGGDPTSRSASGPCGRADSAECLDRPLEWLRGQVRHLTAAGYETLVVDLTPPDVVHLGLHVVRVLIPGFQPLHGNHLWPHLGSRRLDSLSRVFGSNASQPRRWNRYPHPCA